MKFITTAKELIIVLDRKEQIAALKAKIVIKKSEVKDLKWCDVFSDWNKWEVRLPGAAIPGRLIAGSYWTEKGWDFLYLRRPVGFRKPKVADVGVLELKNHSRYERVVLSMTKADFEHLSKWKKSK
jgi:hypothetical protein